MKVPHPYSKEQIKIEINQLLKYLAELSVSCPQGQSDFDIFKKILKRIDEMVDDHWPLLIEQRKEINIGWQAWRVFEGSDFEDLAPRLSDLHSAINADMTQNEGIDLLG